MDRRDGITQVHLESRLDQIKRRLAERGSPLTFMDLTPDLVAAKKDMKVYLKADTHWTVEAAFTVAYTRIMDWIKAAKPNLAPDSFRKAVVTEHAGCGSTGH